MRKRRRWLLIVIPVVAVVLAAAAYFLVEQDLAAQARAGSRVTRQARVVRGNVNELVTASGTISPEDQYSLSFASSGTVVSVTVQPGDRVTAGQALAMVDPKDLRIALAQADDAVSVQQSAIAQLQAPPNALDVAADQAALAVARAHLNTVLAGPDPAAIAAAQAAEQQAWNAYLQADAQRNAARDNPNTPKDERAPLDAAAGLASVSYQIARYQTEQAQEPPSASSVASARAQVVQAQAALDKLNAGATPDDIQSAQLQLALLETKRERAQQALANATLVAPHDGVIATVNLVPGEAAPTGSAAIVLVDDHAYHMDVTVDEIDLMRLHAGQTVSVTVDALPGQTYTGQVGRIAPIGTLINNAMAYDVLIDLAPGSTGLHAGLSASAQIVVAQHAGVLLVPNWAIHIDQATHQAYVTVLRRGGAGAQPGGTPEPGQTPQPRRTPQAGGTPQAGRTFQPGQNGQAAGFTEEVPVTLGLQGDTVTEITSGLTEGETVVLLQAGTASRSILSSLPFRIPGLGNTGRGFPGR